ncbi:MAG: hypothetical protein WC002_05600 [Candidatus Muiribacteriota bacterium]
MIKNKIHSLLNINKNQYLKPLTEISDNLIINNSMWFDFDKFVSDICKSRKKSTLKSTDTVLIYDKKIFFIEFKDIGLGITKINNNTISKYTDIDDFLNDKKKDLRLKISESYIFLIELLKNSNNIEVIFNYDRFYYLVYNSQNNRQFIKEHINNLSLSLSPCNFYIKKNQSVCVENFQRKFLIN